MDIFKKSKEAVKALGEKEAELKAGRIDAAAFKPTGAPMGVYEQRDGRFMFRVRVPAGHLETSVLQAIAKIAKAKGAKTAHVTTRQDLQLHGVEPGSFEAIGKALIKAGVPALGGGGNTVRNVTADPLSGLSNSSLLDVAPIAIALSDYLLGFDFLFSLPRKYKIAFSSSAEDEAGAAWHDLGFVAKKGPDGGKGFAVYGGGGLGREARAAVKLLDFIPPREVFRAALAMGRLFSEHGDREDRNSARIRYIVKRLGEDAFKALFLDYYAKTKAEGAPRLALRVKAAKLPKSAAAKPLRLPFKDGLLDVARLSALAKLAKELKQPFVRLSQDQGVWLPAVKPEDEAKAFKALGLALPPPSPVACIGSGVCKIGALDSRAAAARIAEALSTLKGPAGRIKELADSIRVSGCHNSCSWHLLAPLGLQGLGKAGAGFFKVFVGGRGGKAGVALGVNAGLWSVPEDKVGEFARSLAEAYISSSSSSFGEWIANNAEKALAPWSKAK